MYDLTLLKNNRKLSRDELTIARQICDEAYESVVKRAEYIAKHNIDAEFALPAANWSFEAPNEFVNLFKRIAKADELDINRLRFFTLVFSGYSLFEVTAAAGLTASDICFREDIDQTLAIKLSERNPVFVDEHHRLVADLPGEFIFRPPNMLGEIGHMVNGVLVNNDTNTYQERINLIWESGLDDLIRNRIEENGEIKALEIGGGYGALAYWFKSAFPNASYTIIDLPECLLFSRLYLSLTRPDIKTGFGLHEMKHGLRFLPNYMAEEVGDSFDLIINTLSMSEMTEYQIRKYARLIKTSWLKTGGVFFEQNQDNTSIDLPFAQQILMSGFANRTAISGPETLRNGYPNLWSNDPIVLHKKRRPAPAEVIPRLVESRDGFNIVSYKGKNWVIDQSAGNTDFRDQEQLKRLASSGRLVEMETLDEARAAADRMRYR
ncbi:MAG: putative sugar O-methyltransferase [Nitrospirales bacterium]